MKDKEFFAYMQSGRKVTDGSEIHQYMSALSQRALKITMQMNSAYHTPEELQALMAELTGHPVSDTFHFFPPFYTDCGKNIHFGENVFLNAGCKFQDQGGIFIGDGCLIGHNVVLATINHSMDPEHRGDMTARPIHIGNHVWIGADAAVMPGVTVHSGAVIASGAVVTKDVEANTVVGGVPARVIRRIPTAEAAS